MNLLTFDKISKSFLLNKEEKKKVLSAVSYSFPSSGLFCLLGPSGCGKSTLLNLISLLEKPDDGNIYFYDENINKYKENEKCSYRNNHISFVFQHYNLLDDFDVLFNVELPMLIQGKNEKEARIAAISLLKSVNFKESLYNQKVKSLSGGEKQRVGICRALINDPEIILADEPTGALDSVSAKTVMETLKECSKSKLVICVTHNERLANEYADTILVLNNGRISEYKNNSNLETKPIKTKKRIKSSKGKFVSKIASHNFKKRIGRNLISIFSLVIGITSTLLILGFSKGGIASTKEETMNQFDYGTLTLAKELSSTTTKAGISLVQMLRPTKDEIKEINESLQDYIIDINTALLFFPLPKIEIENKEVKGITYTPIYSFIDNSTDHSLLMKGRFPFKDKLNEVVINEKAYKRINKELEIDVLNKQIHISNSYQHNFYTSEPSNPVISDEFVLDLSPVVVGVVKEQSFMNSEKIYFSYLGASEYLISAPMENYSNYYKTIYTWYDLLENAAPNEEISTYSYYLFLKNINSKWKLVNGETSLPYPFVINSTAVNITSSLTQLVKAATTGMEIFLFVAIIGTILILGIVSFSSYSEDRKTSAILSCLGSSRDSIVDIYSNENLIIGLISFISSLVLFLLTKTGINILIKRLWNFKEIIALPSIDSSNNFILLIFIVFIVVIFITICASYFPISFSKKISISKELRDE